MSYRNEVIVKNRPDNINQAKINEFVLAAEGILKKDDYNFKSVKEIVLFVVFNELATNEVRVKTEVNLSKEEEIDLSFMNSKLRTIVKDNMVDSKFLGINANFYVALDYTQQVEDMIKPTKQQEKSVLAHSKDKKETQLNLQPEAPRYTIDEVVLDKKTRKALNATISLIKKQPLIYEKWGFKEVDSITKTMINFHGEPGTGKTMSVHCIASELGKKIIHVNCSDIESKYVGESNKNIVAAFDLAQEHDAILFFDEADSLLSKRTMGMSSAAHHDNALRSELLKLLEDRAVVIFATNLLSNYDKAFHSRFLRSVKFVLPNKRLRIDMIKKKVPKKLYKEGFNELSEYELNCLSKIADGFSGRDIKQSVLNALIIAASETDINPNRLPTFKDFKKAFKDRKIEINKSRNYC